MSEHYISVAIDGPAGAGKSTLARALAARLGFVYLDTGAIYRTVACYFAMCGISARDTDAITRLIGDVSVAIEYDADGTQRMFLNGEDVTAEIRTPEISGMTSDISAQPVVRNYLLELQRQMAGKHNIIMDGRDIGTVVLPRADVKIYLTASEQVRAGRRQAELAQKGTELPFEQVLAQLQERDRNDMNRKTAPLRQAADAVLLDTSEMDQSGSLAAAEALIRERVAL